MGAGPGLQPRRLCGVHHDRLVDNYVNNPNPDPNPNPNPNRLVDNYVNNPSAPDLITRGRQELTLTHNPNPQP